MVDLKKLKKGSQNILINCANLCKSDRLLIISEDEKFGWYKNDIAKFIYNEASNLGIKTDFLIVGEPKNDNKNKLKTIVNKYDCTICYERHFDTVLVPCGHVICQQCSNTATHCYFCRMSIKLKQKIYLNP